MQIDNPLLTALLLIGLPLLALNVAAWGWQRRQDRAVTVDGGAAMPGSLRETRIHVAPALRAGVSALTAGLAMTLIGLADGAAALLWPGVLLLAVLIWTAVGFWLWELRFDTVGLSAPSQILWRRSYMWRQLERVSDDNPFTWHFHFVDGAKLRIPKHVAGHEDLMRMARHWLALRDEAAR